MRRSTILRSLPWLALIWLLLLPSTAAAFPLSNCSMQISSSTAGGGSLDTAASGDSSASESDPFLVDWDGTVSWDGTVAVEMKNNSYHIEVFGIPTPLRGTSPNQDDNRVGKGTTGVSANAPFRITGLYYVSGAITGSGGTCSGSGVFKLTGDPVGTPPFWLGVALAVLGAILLLRGLAGHLLTGILGGLIGGIGAAILLIIFSTLIVGGSTPVAAVGAGLVLGLVVSLLGKAISRKPVPA